MRKRQHSKKRACGLCKPHKKGLDARWKPRGIARLKEFERARLALVGGEVAERHPETDAAIAEMAP